MSDELLGTIITAIMTIVAAALPPSLLAYRAGQEAKRARVASEAAAVGTVETQVMVQEVALKTDGQLSELVAEVRSVAHAAGVAEGRSASEAEASEVRRVAELSAADRAEGLAEGRAEMRPSQEGS